jgi:dTDP-4-amino-4,6-dideoxy-D-galactose acyltransferase
LAAYQHLSSLEICEFLEWDSRFFGLRIGRIAGNDLKAAQIPAILTWAREHRTDCLYFLAKIDGENIRIAEEHAFHLVDVRMTLEVSHLPGVENRSDDDRIRPVRHEDIAALRAIAGVSHTHSRFFQDGGFPESRCQELYRVWIEKSCHRDADLVLVAEHQRSPAGYITCHLAGSEGSIGLVAVSREARGAGLGSAMLRAALAWFAQRQVTRVSVVTQGANTNAQRLYQNNGFVTRNVQLWYHLWFRNEFDFSNRQETR